MKTYRIKLFLLVICIALMNISLFSCLNKQDTVQPSLFPPRQFSENDLIGSWQEDGAVDSNETLILSTNHKFHQIFDFLQTNYHAESEGSWELRKVQNGCTYIYLYKMKYFYQDLGLANNGNRWPSGIKTGKPEIYWDECSENIIEMPDMVVLFVSQHPNYPKNIILRHMATQRDIVDIFFSLSSKTKE
jgi:hypothetical protein